MGTPDLHVHEPRSVKQAAVIVCRQCSAEAFDGSVSGGALGVGQGFVGEDLLPPEPRSSILRHLAGDVGELDSGAAHDDVAALGKQDKHCSLTRYNRAVP